MITKNALEGVQVLAKRLASKGVAIEAIEETKKGKVNYRTDSFGNVHGIVGKASFDDAKLVENLKAFVEAIMKVKPSTVKGAYVKNVSISSTMGPGVKIDLNSFDK